MRMRARHEVRAHAKVNLDLRILSRRTDGYHEIATVFQSIALHDTVRVSPRAHAGIEVRSTDAALPTDRTNLAWRAAELLGAETGRSGEGVLIEIDKRIPTQAGLGGGSADAAATLVALDAMWGTGLGAVRLAALGARLGADVPFMLHGGTALGTGRGDALSALADLPPYAVIVLRPPFGVSTADAYRWFDEDGLGSGAPPRWPSTSAGWPRVLRSCVNEFEAPVAGRFPGILEAIGELRSLGAAHAAMSGSGSAVFGLFTRPVDPAAIASRLSRAGQAVVVTETLGLEAFRASSAPRVVGIAKG